MKKFTIALLAILYLGVSSGIALQVHYCMGEKAGVELYGEADQKCGKCGMEEKGGCCNDDHKFYKLSDSHKTVNSDFSLAAPEMLLVPAGIPLAPVAIHAADVTNLLRNNSPPVYSGPSAQVLNCVFRI
ncbi:MAG: hypothetical protein Q7T76_03400 [Ferruginibacter sp.]|nr:hypothetical protein [Ferruginibacter sp.]